jgi:putative FmdB family regulatory protein
MPTYEYQCDACGHMFEVFQNMSDAVKRKCPKCGKPKLQRLIGTGAGVLFKGSGFYETDYRSESYRKAAESENKPAESKQDSKPKESTGSASAAPTPAKQKKTSKPGKSASE